MNNNNSKTIVWDNIPEWAIFSLEYGIDEELFLPDEDKEMITKFIVENFPNGYTCRWIGSHTTNSTPIRHSERRARLIR